MDTYLNLVSHPFLWIFLGGSLLFFAIQTLTASKAKSPTRLNRDWASRNYVWLILGTAAVLVVMALTFYLVEIGATLINLVDLLREETTAVRENGLGRPAEDDLDPLLDDSRRTADSSDLRNLAYAVAVLVGVLAASATIVFSLIRVWINERQTRAQEKGLVTDRINKAVEALGAEKEVNRLGRSVRYVSEAGMEIVEFEWNDDRFDYPEGSIVEKDWDNDWSNIGLTAPNIEVRIGGLLSLELLMKDNPEHYTVIMEILTAYIRENAGGVPQPLPEDQSAEAISEWREQHALRSLRLDVDTCLKIIERREPPEVDKAFRPNLERAPLALCDLSGRKLSFVGLHEAELIGSNLIGARLKGANLSFARLQGAELWFAQLQGADLSDARLQGADLRRAKLQGADLGFARLNADTDLSKASLQGALLRSVDCTDLPQIISFLPYLFVVGDVGLPADVSGPGRVFHEPDTGNIIEDERLIRQAWRDWIIEMQKHGPRRKAGTRCLCRRLIGLKRGRASFGEAPARWPGRRWPVPGLIRDLDGRRVTQGGPGSAAGAWTTAWAEDDAPTPRRAHPA